MAHDGMLQIDYQGWLTDTSLGRFHPRSGLLRWVDDAMEGYCTLSIEDSACAIMAALDRLEKRQAARKPASSAKNEKFVGRCRVSG